MYIYVYIYIYIYICISHNSVSANRNLPPKINMPTRILCMKREYKRDPFQWLFFCKRARKKRLRLYHLLPYPSTPRDSPILPVNNSKLPTRDNTSNEPHPHEKSLIKRPIYFPTNPSHPRVFQNSLSTVRNFRHETNKTNKTTSGGDRTWNNHDCHIFKQVFTGVPVRFKKFFTGVPKFPNKFSRE